MSDSLLELLGIPGRASNFGGSTRAEVDSLRETFRSAVSSVNECLRSTVAYGPSDRHKAAASQRDKLFSAYQQVLQELAKDKSPRGDELSAKLLSAVQVLHDKTAVMARDATTNFQQWSKREGEFEDAVTKVSLLEEAHHPKSAVLRKVVDAVRTRRSERDFTGAIQALDQVAPKLASIYDEYTSGQLPPTPDQLGVAATATADKMRTVPGAGGYEYEQHASGAIFIVKSPINGSARTPVQEGTTAYNAIVAEIGPFAAPGGGTGPAVPVPPAEAPVGSLPSTGGEDPVPGSGDDSPRAPVPAGLEDLMAKDELTPEEIAEARRLIGQQPQELQGALYEQLQEKTEYCNQRNNDTSLETSTGGTCNLTAVAMALQYLGVKNPFPQMGFDEALVKIATDENLGSITTVDCWTKVAAKLGVNDVSVFASNVKKNRDWWESSVDNAYLKKGYGVVMSLDGHVVRLQAINDAGLVVDDPYGASKLSGRTFDDNGDGVGDRPKYSFTDSNDADSEDGENSGNAGDDTGYPWSDVEKYTFKYLVAFK